MLIFCKGRGKSSPARLPCGDRFALLQCLPVPERGAKVQGCKRPLLFGIKMKYGAIYTTISHENRGFPALNHDFSVKNCGKPAILSGKVIFSAGKLVFGGINRENLVVLYQFCRFEKTYFPKMSSIKTWIWAICVSDKPSVLRV